MPSELTDPRADLLSSVDSAVHGWQLRDNERGRHNLSKLIGAVIDYVQREFMQTLEQALPRCPDPDMSLNNLERFLANPQGLAYLPSLMDPERRFLATLISLLGSSQFFSDLLAAHPDFVAMIRIPIRAHPSREQLKNELQEEVDAAFEESVLLRAFRRFRQRHVLRIGTNDLIHDRSLEEITQDISRVADVSLEVALQTARRNVSKRFGYPIGLDGQPARCVILAFGKLGGEELNYSSDIDLMFLYDHEGETAAAGAHAIANSDYFARVASQVVRLLSAHTDAGQAYRVDLRLRPEGDRGPLARSLDSTFAYYDSLGRTWERQALIKVRPAAGDLELGREFLRGIEPFIWRKYLSLSEINEIKALKRRIEKQPGRRGLDASDVKTGFGGIRDVEFTIQFLQLLNGWDLPEVRTTNTLHAIHALQEAGCLTYQEAQFLDRNYRFLRQTEHRLQLMFDLQTHTLPENDVDLHRLASSLRQNQQSPATAVAGSELSSKSPATAVDGSKSPSSSLGAVFLTEYHEKTKLNRKILDHLLHEAFTDDDEKSVPETDLILDPQPDRETIDRVLGNYPFKDVQQAYRGLTELARESVPFLSMRRCRHFLASIAPRLLKALAETPDPDMALVNLQKVSDSLGGKGVLWGLFSFSHAALKLYVDLCAGSQFLSDILINNPGMIDDLLDSLMLNRPRSADEMRGELADLCRHAEDPDVILHSFQDKELLRIGVRDILGKETVRATTKELSDLAQVILAQITDLQLAPMRERFGVPYLGAPASESAPPQAPASGLAPPQARFVLLGLGKLGGREMSYQSDLDLMLIYEGDGRTGPPPGANRFEKVEETELFQYFTELAQRIIKAASLLGPHGRLYQVDMRLRPTGKSGSLVIPLAEFQRYYTSKHAQLWERQALTRARVVCGDEDFGSVVKAALEQAVYGAEWRPEMAGEIAAMRERVQASGGGRRDLKRGFGGIIDVEFLVQLYRLKFGKNRPALRGTNTWTGLKACKTEGVIAPGEFDILWSSYEFLRLVESRLRIVHNRSLDEIPEDKEDLEKLARRLGFESDDTHAASDGFLNELEDRLQQTRTLFTQLVEREKKLEFTL